MDVFSKKEHSTIFRASKLEALKWTGSIKK
jgi:hypothetical protein